jgi:hypothetical protein
VLTARADLEDKRGNPAGAASLEHTALRYSYARPEPRDIAISHHNLANYLGRAGGDPAARRAHRLAGALISDLAGMAHDRANTVQALAIELGGGAGAGGLPAGLGEVVAVTGQVEGVRLGELVAALQPDLDAAEAALAAIIRDAADPEGDAIAGHLQRWEPVIAAAVAAAGGSADAAAELAPVLDELAGTSDWAALVAVLRRILGGERAPGLLDGLGALDTAIAAELLARLGVASAGRAGPT